MRLFVVLTGLVVLASCREATEPRQSPRVRTVEVTLTIDSLLPGATTTVQAVARDIDGETVENVPLVWSSSNSTIVQVSNAGVVTAINPGTASISASIEGRSGSATMKVLVPVATILIMPSDTSVGTGDTIRLRLLARDSAGNLLTGRVPAWSISTAWQAGIDSSGLAMLHAPGSVTVTASLEGKSGSTSVSALVTFESVDAGGLKTCATATDGRVYCWGRHLEPGELGSALDCGTSCVQPVPIATLPLGFSAVVLGPGHACARTHVGSVYCWGDNHFGETGRGSFEYFSQVLPALVTGGMTFSQVALGLGFSCAAEQSLVLWCWGFGGGGRLASDSVPACQGATLCVPSPIRIPGFGFTSAALGYEHACALDQSGLPWCWGGNSSLQLGIPDSAATGCVVYQGYAITTKCEDEPVPVRGSLPALIRISSFSYHTCGLSSSYSVFCWGSNLSGRLGDGTTISHDSAVTVIGLPPVIAISVGGDGSCALTASGDAWCWGGSYGLVPTKIAGFTFKQIDAGVNHWCGLANDDLLYCWGGNAVGQLGTGDSTDYSTPQRVYGQR